MADHKMRDEDIIQLCLDQIEAGASVESCLRDFPAQAAELAPLLEVAVALRSWQAPTLSATGRQAALERALASLDVPTAPPKPSRPWWLSVRQPRYALQFALALALLFVALGSSVAAAETSLPGDWLYGLKRANENVRLQFAMNPGQHAVLYLNLADRRAQEVLALRASARSVDSQTLNDLAQSYERCWESIAKVAATERAPLIANIRKWCAGTNNGDVVIASCPYYGIITSIMRVLITGITGLIGSHLADYLLELGDVDVIGFKRWRSANNNISHLRGRVRMLEGDVEDPYSVASAIEQARPDRIFHLAAQSYPSESWAAPATTLGANFMSTLHVLEAARRLVPNARIHVASSAAAYGIIQPDEVPIREDRPLWPVSPYGVSKAAAEMLAYQAAQSYGQQVYLTRSFIHIGPRQDPRPAAQTFALQIAEAEAGLRTSVIDVGNLHVQRDFLDVADAVRGLWALIERGEPGQVYNLCSGRATSIRALLDIYLALATQPMQVREDPSRLRLADEPILQGDNTKLRAATGWQPRVSLEESCLRILSYWRTHLLQS